MVLLAWKAARVSVARSKGEGRAARASSVGLLAILGALASTLWAASRAPSSGVEK